MLMIETSTKKEFSLSGVVSMPLLDAGKARTLLLSLDAGQAVAPCQMSFLVLYYFIEGQGQISHGRRASRISARLSGCRTGWRCTQYLRQSSDTRSGSTDSITGSAWAKGEKGFLMTIQVIDVESK